MSTGGIRSNFDSLTKEKHVYKDWFCTECNKSLFISHLISDENRKYNITPPTCCNTPMADKRKTMKFSNHKMHIIKDIEPYMTVAADKSTKQICYISSRREHNDFLKRNDYEEVGNDPLKSYLNPERKSPINRDDVGWALEHAAEVTQSDQFKEYAHKANKGVIND